MELNRIKFKDAELNHAYYIKKVGAFAAIKEWYIEPLDDDMKPYPFVVKNYKKFDNFNFYTFNEPGSYTFTDKLYEVFDDGIKLMKYPMGIDDELDSPNYIFKEIKPFGYKISIKYCDLENDSFYVKTEAEFEELEVIDIQGVDIHFHNLSYNDIEPGGEYILNRKYVCKVIEIYDITNSNNSYCKVKYHAGNKTAIIGGEYNNTLSRIESKAAIIEGNSDINPSKINPQAAIIEENSDINLSKIKPEPTNELDQFNEFKNEFLLKPKFLCSKEHLIINLYWLRINNAARYTVTLYAIDDDSKGAKVYYLKQFILNRYECFLSIENVIIWKLIIVISAEDREGNIIAKTKGLDIHNSIRN